MIASSFHIPSGIVWSFPVYILVEHVFKKTDDAGNTISMSFDGPMAIRLKDESTDIRAFPIFSDTIAADKYLAKRKSNHEPYVVTDKHQLLEVLKGVRKSVVAVVLDPLEVANPKPVETVIAELEHDRE